MKIEKRKKYQNLSKQYVCENCGIAFVAPFHCGHPMHIVKTNKQIEWNCWMGQNCGTTPLEGKCNSPSLIPV